MSEISIFLGGLSAGIFRSLPMTKKAGVLILPLNATEAQRDEKPLEVQTNSKRKNENPLFVMYKGICSESFDSRSR